MLAFAFFQDAVGECHKNTQSPFARPMMRYLLALLTVLLAPPRSSAPGPLISRVAWLAGCWELKDSLRLVQENWMAPMGNTMISSGRTVRADSLIDYELIVLRAGVDKLYYEAHPAGQAAATFVAAKVSEQNVLFANRGHDFPQEIGYERRGADSLLAWIAGPMEGKTRRIEFPYARVRCP